MYLLLLLPLAGGKPTAAIDLQQFAIQQQDTFDNTYAKHHPTTVGLIRRKYKVDADIRPIDMSLLR